MFWSRRRRRPADEADAAPTCGCGSPLDLVDMDIGFGLPDDVAALAPEEQAARIRGFRRVFVLDETRGFVRTLLPVDLDHGSVTFGIWLEIAPAAAVEAGRCWDSPAYLDLRLWGTLANRLPPWEETLEGVRVTARPASQDELPTVVDGDEPVRRLLDRQWPRAGVVAGFPELAHLH